MADFAIWGEAIARAMDYDAGKFLAVYQANIDRLQIQAIEADVVGDALLKFMNDKEEWKGTPSELLECLKQQEPDSVLRSKPWPKAAHVLTQRINILKTNLIELGIKIESWHTGEHRVICIKKPSVSSVNALESGESSQNNPNAVNATDAKPASIGVNGVSIVPDEITYIRDGCD
jgi:hypothetical protein